MAEKKPYLKPDELLTILFRPILKFATHTCSPCRQKQIRQLELKVSTESTKMGLQSKNMIIYLMIAGAWPALIDRRKEYNIFIKLFDRHVNNDVQKCITQSCVVKLL